MNTQRCFVMMVGLIGWTVLGGCSANMQVVRKDAQGGTIAVWGPTVPAATDARHVMVEHCRGRFSLARGSANVGLGAADPLALPSDAQVLTYRCARPTRSTVAAMPTTAAQQPRTAKN